MNKYFRYGMKILRKKRAFDISSTLGHPCVREKIIDNIAGYKYNGSTSCVSSSMVFKPIGLKARLFFPSADVKQLRSLRRHFTRFRKRLFLCDDVTQMIGRKPMIFALHARYSFYYQIRRKAWMVSYQTGALQRFLLSDHDCESVEPIAPRNPAS